MPSVNAVAVSAQPTTHIEFEMTLADAQKFVSELTQYLQSSRAGTIHLQIERRGVAPPSGGTAPIEKGDPVTIVIHRFP